MGIIDIPLSKVGFRRKSFPMLFSKDPQRSSCVFGSHLRAELLYRVVGFVLPSALVSQEAALTHMYIDAPHASIPVENTGEMNPGRFSEC